MIRGEITGEIWDLTDLKAQVAALDDDMELVINSPGGSVMEGLELINLIQKCEKKIKAKVEVQFSSIAAVIALACDGLEIKKTDFMVLHNCMTFAMGNKEALQQEIEAMTVVDSILHDYIAARCKDPEDLIAQLDEGKDVWLTGAQVAEMFEGVDLCEPKKKQRMQNCIDFGAFIAERHRVDAQLVAANARVKELEAIIAERDDRDRRMAHARRIMGEVFTNA